MRISIVCYLTVTLCAVFSNDLIAQKQGNIWYFGETAGLDFNTSPPAPLLNGQLNTYEGCASIADDEGELLFYTDGVNVWNKNHQPMPNGNMLAGDPSSTQSGVIVPRPNHPNLYYIFTVDWNGGTDGVNYSIVDLTAEGGLGNVIEKNTPLLSRSPEKITAVAHNNEKGYWLIAHDWGSNAFYAYLITSNGIDPTPVVSNVGIVHEGWIGGTIGYLKASSDGEKIAIAAQGDIRAVEVFNFDNETGQISNPVTLTNFPGGGGPYGIEFSPNGQFLYVSERSPYGFDVGENHLYQFDLLSNDVPSSQTEIAIVTDHAMGALQMAPDEKIYLALTESEYLGVIHNPNQKGTACNFEKEGQYLGGRRGLQGLPTFVQSFFQVPDFTVSDICYLDNTLFTLEDSSDIDEAIWNFGDPASGDSNTGSGFAVDHTFSAPGNYVVQVTFKADSKSNTTFREITIAPLPEVELGQDTLLYYGDQLVLDASHQDFTTYTWQDSSASSTFLVSEPGSYYVMITDKNACMATDTINIDYDQLIDVNLGNDTTLCLGQDIMLDASLPGATYSWSDGSTNGTLQVTEPGTYWVEITNAYGTRTKTDSITVNYYEFSELHPNDTLICEEGGAILHATGAQGDEYYQWYESFDAQVPLAENDGIFIADFLNTSTTFFVSLTNGTCESEKVPVTAIIETPDAQIVADTTIIKFGEQLQLTASGGNTYQWEPQQWISNDTIATPLVQPHEDITYIVWVTTAGGCTDSASISIIVQKELLIPKVFTPNDDGINDSWVIENIDNFPGNKVTVFNRRGELVFEMLNYQNNWTGQFRGQPLPEDTYFYLVNKNDNKTPNRGSVTIVR